MKNFIERHIITTNPSLFDNTQNSELISAIAPENTQKNGNSSVERLIVIDSNVDISKQHIETFIDNGFEILELDANHDGIEQITDTIASTENIGTIDLLAHGSRGNLILGNTEINSNTLKHYQNDLTGLTGASQSMDILLYGCEVAAGEVGRAFVEEFSTLTKADVAASVDLTGSKELGGDWQLESHVGKIEATPITIAKFDSVLNSNRSLLENSGFDSPLDNTGWLVGKTGKVEEYERNGGKVASIENIEGSVTQMYLKLPQEAEDNYGDQLSLFQDVSGLKPNKVYAVEAKVKWLNPENNLPSAIVSFWAKNPNNTFRGQDFKITDGNGYKNLRFEFTPNEAGTTRFFLGLFTHVQGNSDDTEILVDNYKVTEIGEMLEGLDTRKGNLLNDGNFDNYKTSKVWNLDNKGWYHTEESPVPELKQSISNSFGDSKLRLELPKAQNNQSELNNTSTGVFQNVNLVEGQKYNLSANFQRMGLDKFADKEDSIVQFMAFRERENGENLFLGPIDVILNDDRSISKNFDIIAPDSGNYTILVRLAGWANQGNGITVEVDNVDLRTA